MESWVQTVLTAVAAILASSGFWAFMQHKDRARSATTKLLMGMAYDQITRLGVAYIDRGWITKDEYEELRKYFYEPYRNLGGNGVAERIMSEVSQLPIISHSKYSEIFRNSQERSYVPVHVTQAGQESSPQ